MLPQSSSFASAVLRQWVLAACLGEVGPSFLQASLLQGLLSAAAHSHLLPIASAVSTKQWVMAGGNGVGSLILLLPLNC